MLTELLMKRLAQGNSGNAGLGLFSSTICCMLNAMLGLSSYVVSATLNSRLLTFFSC